MAKIIYKWKRFWFPPTGTLNLSDEGYLYDPDSEHGQFYNPDVVPFEKIRDTLCLVLFGEPELVNLSLLHFRYQ